MLDDLFVFCKSAYRLPREADDALCRTGKPETRAHVRRSRGSPQVIYFVVVRDGYSVAVCPVGKEFHGWLAGYRGLAYPVYRRAALVYAAERVQGFTRAVIVHFYKADRSSAVPVHENDLIAGRGGIIHYPVAGHAELEPHIAAVYAGH